MKRVIASLRFSSAWALATITRMVWPRTSAESVARATTRIWPASISFRPNGGEAQPTSTWSVITAVRVEEGLPVGVGLAFRSNSFMNASTIELVEEPRVENAIVLSLVSFRVLIGEDVFAYQ